MPSPVTGICRLCGHTKRLHAGHVIPQLIFRWFKRQDGLSARMFAAAHDEPTMEIVQDGYRRYLLCNGCEQKFSKWEREFRDGLFVPFHDGDRLPIGYGRWGLKFGVSVLWRILAVDVEEHPEAVNPAVARDIDRCLRQWKAFLCDDARSPKVYEVHLVPIVFDRSSRHSEQYLHGTIEWETIFHRPTDQAYLILKFGRLLLVGVLRNATPKAWRETKLHVEGGVWGAGRFVIPESIVAFVQKRVLAMPHSIRRPLGRNRSGHYDRKRFMNLRSE